MSVSAGRVGLGEVFENGAPIARRGFPASQLERLMELTFIAGGSFCGGNGSSCRLWISTLHLFLGKFDSNIPIGGIAFKAFPKEVFYATHSLFQRRWIQFCPLSHLDTPVTGRFVTRFYLKSGSHSIFTAAIYAETGYGVENSELLRI